MGEEDIGCCFDGWVSRWERRERKKGLRKETLALRNALIPQIQDASFVEIGCGIGALTRELVKNGAANGAGFDLSKDAIQTARRLAAEAGMLDRARFDVANGALAPLPERPVIVMDKVICCYPEPNALIPHAISAETNVCGLVIPISKGMVGKAISFFVKIENFIFKMRRIEFRAFVHKQSWIDDLVLTQGLSLTKRDVKFPWVISIYKRGDSDSSAVLTAAAATSR